MRHRLARPGFIGRSPGWVRSSTWIWLFSSTESTRAVRRRVEVKANDIAQFGGKERVAAELEDPQPMPDETMGVHCPARPMGSLVRRSAEACARSIA